jgi:hypothetical protein
MAKVESRIRGSLIRRLSPPLDLIDADAAPLSRRTERVLLAVLIALVAATRTAFVAINHARIVPRSDEFGYRLIGRDFHDWLTGGNAIRGPAYPALIAVLDGSVRAVQYAQVAAELLALVIILIGVRAVWGQLPALATGALWLTYLPYAYYDDALLTEAVNLPLVAAIGILFVVLWNRRSLQPLVGFACLGALIGMEELVRPTSWKLWFAIAALVAWRHSSLRATTVRMLAMTVIFLLVVGPWLDRNYHIYGRVLSGTGTAHSTLIGVLPLSLIASAPDLGPPTPALARLGYDYPFRPLRNDRIGLYAQNDRERDLYSQRMLFRFLRHDAWRFRGTLLSEHLSRPFKLWFRSSISDGENAVAQPHRGDRLRPAFSVWHVALVLCALASLAIFRGLLRQTLPWVTLAVATTVVVTLILLPQARYALPVMPFVLAWAGIGVASAVVAGGDFAKNRSRVS